MNSAEQISLKILELKEALLANNPMMPVLLRTIHKQLQDDPAVVTILSPEEVATIVTGLYKHTGIEITGSVKKAEKAKLKNLTIDDL